MIERMSVIITGTSNMKIFTEINCLVIAITNFNPNWRSFHNNPVQCRLKFSFWHLVHSLSFLLPVLLLLLLFFNLNFFIMMLMFQIIAV